MMVGSKINYDISNLDIPKDNKEDIDYQKSFNAILTIIVRDKKGNVIKRYKQKSHSPTANFIGLMLPLTWYNETGNSWTFTNNINNTSSYIPSITGNGSGIIYPNNGFNIGVNINNILVGSGSQSNPYSAYNLASPISNGSGTGQLIYSSISTPTNITINGNQAYFIISQAYANQSGGTINITEIGIFLNLFLGNTTSNSTSNITRVYTVLVWYDVLSSPISVGSGQNVVIYYTFTVNA
ncbi:MAG: hypothetical protein RXO36_08365 [Candidatus Nanopusillus acidilobi]